MYLNIYLGYNGLFSNTKRKLLTLGIIGRNSQISFKLIFW